MSGSVEDSRARLDQSRVHLLKSDFLTCFTFAAVAAARLKTGNQESAEQAIADAEKGYTTLSHLLSDPKHVSTLTADQVREFTTELQRLRERLDGLRR